MMPAERSARPSNDERPRPCGARWLTNGGGARPAVRNVRRTERSSELSLLTGYLAAPEPDEQRCEQERPDRPCRKRCADVDHSPRHIHELAWQGMAPCFTS